MAKEMKKLEHPIGLAINLDTDNIESLLTPDERKLLENPKANGLAIAMLFNRKLFGDFYNGTASYQRVRSASDFFPGKQRDRGACREKALILHNLLKHYGIPSRLRVGWTTDTVDDNTFAGDHVWVELLDQDIDLDPAKSDTPFVRWDHRNMFIKFYVGDHGEIISADGNAGKAQRFEIAHKQVLHKMIDEAKEAVEAVEALGIKKGS